MSYSMSYCMVSSNVLSMTRALTLYFQPIIFEQILIIDFKLMGVHRAVL